MKMHTYKRLLSSPILHNQNQNACPQFTAKENRFRSNVVVFAEMP